MRNVLFIAILSTCSTCMSAQSCPNGVKVYVCGTCSAGSLCATNDDRPGPYFDGFFTNMSSVTSRSCTTPSPPVACLHGTDPCSGQQFIKYIRSSAHFIGVDCSSGNTVSIDKESRCGFT